MKNSTAPNRKTGRMIAKNLIVLFTVALAGFCGIQAWFTDKSSAEADGINVECQAPDGIKIAVVKHNDPAPKDTEYTVGNIKLNKTNCKFLENLQLTEITSDGTDFYKPALIQTGGQAQVDTKADWSPAAKDIYKRIKYNINYDIIGMATPYSITYAGVKDFEAIFEKVFEKCGSTLDIFSGPVPCDTLNLTSNKIPSLTMSNGGFVWGHTPADDMKNIDKRGFDQPIDFSSELINYASCTGFILSILDNMYAKFFADLVPISAATILKASSSCPVLYNVSMWLKTGFNFPPFSTSFSYI